MLDEARQNTRTVSDAIAMVDAGIVAVVEEVRLEGGLRLDGDYAQLLERVEQFRPILAQLSAVIPCMKRKISRGRKLFSSSSAAKAAAGLPKAGGIPENVRRQYDETLGRYEQLAADALGLVAKRRGYLESMIETLTAIIVINAMPVAAPGC